MTVNDEETVLLAVIFVIVILRLYINSLKPEPKSTLPAKQGCPGDGTGRLHKWEYDLTNGGYVCTICNKKPGQFYE